MNYTELNGAWEERGVRGTRIEIEGNRILILWMNRTVLETTFDVKNENDGLTLEPADRGLRNSPQAEPYAEVTKLFLKEGKLEFEKLFEISGPSREVLEKTEFSRYGNYEIRDDILADIQGVWKNKDGFFKLTIKDDNALFGNTSAKIHVIKAGWLKPSDNEFWIADADPSVEGWEGFTRFRYENGRMFGKMIIYDAPSYDIEFFR